MSYEHSLLIAQVRSARRSEALQSVFALLCHIFVAMREAPRDSRAKNLGEIPSTGDEQVDHLIGLSYELGVLAALGENDHPYAVLASRIEEFRRSRSPALKSLSYPRRQRTPPRVRNQPRRPEPAGTSLPDDI